MPKYGGKFGASIEVWEGGSTCEGPYLPRYEYTLWKGGSTGLERKIWWGITIDGEPACPAVPHHSCVAVGTCQGSC